MGSLKSLCTTFYRSSIETIALNCLVFEKIAFFAFWRQTDRDKRTNGQTDGHHRCVKPQSRYLELQLNKKLICRKHIARQLRTQYVDGI